MRFVFYRPRDWVGYLICLRTGGIFSHVAVEVGDYRYQARSFSGVTMEPAKSWPGDCVIVDVDTGGKEDDAKRFLEECVSFEMGYDYIAILSFLVMSKRQSRMRYFCSELAYDALVACGLQKKADKLISPQDLYGILNQKCSPR